MTNANSEYDRAMDDGIQEGIVVGTAKALTPTVSLAALGTSCLNIVIITYASLVWVKHGTYQGDH